MTQIVLENFNLGGLSDSKYSGLANSAYKIEGFNIHEEPGILKVQQAIVADQSVISINQKVNSIVPLNDGKSYIFGASGRYGVGIVQPCTLKRFPMLRLVLGIVGYWMQKNMGTVFITLCLKDWEGG